MPKTTDAVMLFTAESADQIITTGGTQWWKAKLESLKKRPYVVATHSGHADWGKSKGTAFLVGRISDIKESPENGWRKMLFIDKYALIDIAGAWPTGNRNPIAYVKLSKLGIDPDSLRWQDLKAPETPVVQGPVATPKPSAVVDQARLAIARAFSIDPSKVRISVDV